MYPEIKGRWLNSNLFLTSKVAKKMTCQLKVCHFCRLPRELVPSTSTYPLRTLYCHFCRLPRESVPSTSASCQERTPIPTPRSLCTWWVPTTLIRNRFRRTPSSSTRWACVVVRLIIRIEIQLQVLCVLRTFSNRACFGTVSRCPDHFLVACVSPGVCDRERVCH